MPFREIKRREQRLIIKSEKEGYIKIPYDLRQYFNRYVKILFDPEQSLLALQPSDDTKDFTIPHWRIWCTKFLRTYGISSQEAEAIWDKKNKFLIAKVKRDR
jgi:hypothetical protein